jgi:hypothetical protein
MKTVLSLNQWVNFYQTTRCHIPKDGNLYRSDDSKAGTYNGRLPTYAQMPFTGTPIADKTACRQVQYVMFMAVHQWFEVAQPQPIRYESICIYRIPIIQRTFHSAAEELEGNFQFYSRKVN